MINYRHSVLLDDGVYFRKPGRPSKLNPAQMKKLQTFLNQSQASSKPMKAETLASHILKEFLTNCQGWRILKRLEA
ncbi:MAG: hypothetical protein PHY43_14915 [Verrucomicrobiales bacterium]|nr:hypothetical protein [Verrucomicrobiales bacterium]